MPLLFHYSWLSLWEAVVWHHARMPNQKPKDQPESKFAEVIRKGKEKRAVLNKQSAKRAEEEEKSLQREEANGVDQAFQNIRDSEI